MSSAADWSRRRFLKTSVAAGAGIALAGCSSFIRPDRGVFVNDVHSRLTPTRVRRIVRPRSEAELVASLRRGLRHPGGISIAGGRHAMGAQPFGTDSLHFDLTGVNRVGELDSGRGIVSVDAGADWPTVMAALDDRQNGVEQPWCIRQKQTGADQLTLGGAIAANIHGRGLTFRPFVQDVEGLDLVTAAGDVIPCSRDENPDWFALAVGGYGLFGVVTRLQLRLMRREVVRREVKRSRIDDIGGEIARLVEEGCLYGDFQFATAPETEEFLRDGLLSVYRPVPYNAESVGAGTSSGALSTERWKQLITLAHTDKARAFSLYADYYLTTDGRHYWSDRQQMSTYLPDYHEVVAGAFGHAVRQSLIITELYVPRERLGAFFDGVREDFIAHKTDLVYGVVRWIERDDETYLPWATQDYACIIFNLNVRHGSEGEARAAADFRRLIDRALEAGGSYYLTYHRHAEKRQVEAAYPNFTRMLAEKETRDPRHVWNSDWFRHYRAMFG